MASLGDLLVRVGADITGFEKNMGDVSKQLIAVDRDANKAFAGFDRIGDRIGAITGPVGGLLTAGLTVPLAAAGAAAVKFGSDFELGLARVNSLGGTTEKQITALRDGALELSKRLGIDAVGATEALYEAISAGVPPDNAITFLETASKASVAGLTTTKISVDALTSVLNAYGLQADQAKTVSDAMFQAVNVGKFTFDQLGASLSVATPLAAQLGVSFQEVFAAAATLTTQGFAVSEAMTAVRGAMVAIISPNKDMNALLAATGYESGQALIKAKGFEGALGALRDAAQGNVTTLTNAFGRVEALGAVLGTTGQNAAIAAQHLDTVRNSAGAADNAFQKITESNSQKFEQLKNRIEAVAISFGEKLYPIVGKVLDLAGPLVDKVGQAVEYFGTLPGPVQNAALALGAVLAAAGPLLLAVGPLLATLTSMGVAFTSLGAATAGTGAALGPLAVLLPAIGTVLSVVSGAALAVGAAWLAWKFRDDIPLFDLLKNALSAVGQALGLLYDAGKAIAPLFGTVLYSAFSKLVEVIGFLLSPLKLLSAGLGALGDGVKAARSAMNGLIQPTEKLSDAQLTMGKRFADAADGIKIVSKETPKATSAIADHGKAVELAKSKVIGLLEKDELLAAKVAIVAAEHNKAVREVAAYQLSVERGTAKSIDLTTAMGDLSEITKQAAFNFKDISGPVGVLAVNLGDVKKPVDTLRDALKTLGITGAADLQTVAAEAAKARDAVLGSGEASDFEKKSAIYRALKAQVEYSAAAGIEITQKQRDTLKAMADEIDGQYGLGKQKDKWSTFSNQVSTIITNLAQDIGKTLFDGDLSWAEKGKKILGEVGQAFVSAFTEKATKAIGDFIAGAITDLLSGKGLGGVLSRVIDIGKNITDIFGGGASAASGAAGAAGTAAGGAASTAGSAASTAGSVASSGVTAIVGAVASVATAISSVVGNFQMAGMNKTLDLIENYTRYAKSYLRDNIVPDLQTYLPGIINFRDFCYDVMHPDLMDIIMQTERTASVLENIRVFALQIADNTAVAAQNSVKQLPPMNFNVAGNVIGNREFINELSAVVTANVRLQLGIA